MIQIFFMAKKEPKTKTGARTKKKKAQKNARVNEKNADGVAVGSGEGSGRSGGQEEGKRVIIILILIFIFVPVFVRNWRSWRAAWATAGAAVIVPEVGGILAVARGAEMPRGGVDLEAPVPSWARPLVTSTCCCPCIRRAADGAARRELSGSDEGGELAGRC